MDLGPLLSGLCVGLLADSAAQQSGIDLHGSAIVFMTWVIVLETVVTYTLYTVKRITAVVRETVCKKERKSPKRKSVRRKNQKSRSHKQRAKKPDRVEDCSSCLFFTTRGKCRLQKSA